MQLNGIVKTITYHNEDNGYSIFRIEPDNRKGYDTTCVGYITPLDEGDYLSLDGDYVIHDTYGRQFKAKKINKSVPSDVNVFSDYLSLSIDGVGPVTAKKIVSLFGKYTLRVIENEPEKLGRVSGISKKKAMKIHDSFMASNVGREEQLFFLSVGISNNLAAKVKKTYAEKTRDIITTNPYDLIDKIKGVGFKKADEIASKVGISKNSYFRIYHGVLFRMDEYVNAAGNVYYPLADLVMDTAKMLCVSESLITEVINSLVKDGKLIIEDNCVYTSILYNIENNIANDIARRSRDCKIYDESLLDKKVKEIEKQKGKVLDETQREAVKMAIKNNFIIITGGPGTGKTTTLDVLITYLSQIEKKSVSLAAPTGRAAQRMSEQTKRPSQTLHRLVGCNIGKPSDEYEKLESDVIVVDEMSMVDIFLMNTLMKSLKADTKVVLVGDVCQLPSVGPGMILRDIIDSQVVAVARLTKIHRQSETSTIIPNAHAINNGKMPNLTTSDDFFYIERKDQEDGLAVLLTMMLKNIPNHFKCKPTDVQVLAPMRKGMLGIENLNKVLQWKLNPPRTGLNEIKIGNQIFRENDKVMHTKNCYRMEWSKSTESGMGVFNGECGRIKKIDINRKLITVNFEDKDGDKIVHYTYEDAELLTLSYAITIHKSQGSEYPVVIIPIVSGGPPSIYNRALLYTAVTRASKCVGIIGLKKILASMVHNKDTAKRCTKLKERLKN